jgi:hypothetical protein
MTGVPGRHRRPQPIHRDDGYTLPGGVRVLTDWMRDAGYFTANLVSLPEPCGFSGTGKTDWNFTYEGKPFDSANWADLKMHQPFYAQINFQETHRKFHGPKKADPAKVLIPPYYPDHPLTRKDWAEYLDDASELDRKAGLVVKQLENDGLADNTIVMFFGDHGQAHVRGKQFCYEDGLHIPLIIRWPKHFPAPKQIKPGLVDDSSSKRLIAATISQSPERTSRRRCRAAFSSATTLAPPPFAFGACRWKLLPSPHRGRAVSLYSQLHPTGRSCRQTTQGEKLSRLNLLKELHAQGKPPRRNLCQPTMPAGAELYDPTDRTKSHLALPNPSPSCAQAPGGLKSG